MSPDAKRFQILDLFGFQDIRLQGPFSVTTWAFKTPTKIWSQTGSSSATIPQKKQHAFDHSFAMEMGKQVRAIERGGKDSECGTSGESFFEPTKKALGRLGPQPADLGRSFPALT